MKRSPDDSTPLMGGQQSRPASNRCSAWWHPGDNSTRLACSIFVVCMGIFGVVPYAVQRYRPNVSAGRVLYAVTSADGLGKQTGSLACYLELAKLAERQLVLMPFQSDGHYGKRVDVYLDRYVQAHGWRTVRTTDDTSILQDLERNCVLGHLSSGDSFYRSKPNSMSVEPIKISDVAFERYSQLRPSATEVAAQLAATSTQHGEGGQYACVLMSQDSTCNGGAARFRPSWEVMSKVREAREKIYGGHAGSYRAMHLRRGVDKCTDSQNPDDPSTVGEVRCGSMKNMPFLKQCKGDPKAAEGAASRPLYVATDEADDKEIKVLRDAGCVTFADTGLGAEDKAMVYAVEAELYRSADETLTLGCSWLAEETRVHREAWGLSSQRLYDPTTQSFELSDPMAAEGYLASLCNV